MALGKGKDKSEDEKGSKNGRGLIIVLFILGLLVLGSAAFGGVYLFMKTKNTVDAQKVVVENEYMDLDEFTVNLADEGGKRFFKGQLSLGYDKSKNKLKEELTANQVVIRDDIIFYFKSKTADYLNNVSNREEIKNGLMNAINQDLTKGKIADIRFKSMIIQ